MKTFAEKLKEHTAYCDEVLRQVHELAFQIATKKSEAKRLDKELEKIIKLSDATIKKFETEHKEELKALELFVKNSE